MFAQAKTTPFTSDFYNNEYQHLKEKDPQENITGRPKAYLNFVLFDEQFKLVEENSGVKQVKAEPDQLQTLAQDKMVIKQSGFLYIYTSNESPQDVFFDNVILEHITGPVLEETHYYPYGLVMDGISGRAPGTLENKNLYNGKELQHNEFSTGGGLEWYDYGARMYDAQVGRFHVQDRFADKYQPLTPYHYGANNPVLFIDVNGDSLYLFNASQTAKDKFTKTVNDGLGGFYTIGFDPETNQVRLIETGKEGLMTDAQKGFYDVLNGAVNSSPSDDISFSLVESDESVFVDRFNTAELDIDDVAQYKDGKAVTPVSVIGHFFAEQQARKKFIGGKGYKEAHTEDAFSAEKKITGYTRDPAGEKAEYTTRPGNKASGTYESIYRKGNETRRVVLSVTNSNVTKISEEIQNKTMRVIVFLLCCFYLFNTEVLAQDPKILSTKDSTQKLFIYHFKILDKAAKKSRKDTVHCCTASIDFMEGYTKMEPGTEGSFTGRWGFTKMALKQWHEWYDKKYKRKSN